MTGTYRIAGRSIRIDSLFEEVQRLCAGYSEETETVDIAVRTVPEDIAFEQEKSEKERTLSGLPPVRYEDSYLETLAVYRQIAERMPAYDTVLFHGSCIAVDGAAYLFTAKSGTGKSTHTRLWREMLGEKAVMVNDDKPLIRLTKDGAVICGTPWDGKHHLSSRTEVPLKAICLLERAAENSIRPAGFYECYPMLLQQVYRPMDGASMKKTLELIDRLAASVSLWRLGCNMDPEAAQISYNAMKD